MMNQKAMMQQIKRLQKEMLETQQEIESTEFKTTCGPVTLTMLGDKSVTKVEIDKSYVIESNEDLELLEDSFVAASASLIKDINKYTEDRMGKYRQFLGGF